MRILQRLSTNVLKHSGANRVDVEIENEAAALRLEVTDKR